MKKFLKWAAIIVALLLATAFILFLYFIPPFLIAPPEEFSKPLATAGPSLDGITDPAERLLAERGKYIVTVHDCSGCHTPVGDQGPIWEEYLAGGGKGIFKGYGTFVSRNLTPDKETGLARRTDDQVKRVLRSGLLPEGRVAYHRDMPWAVFSNWTEEDRHAVVVYLRHLKPVYHAIPPDTTSTAGADTGAAETLFGADAAKHK
jgi:hypothetical protein